MPPAAAYGRIAAVTGANKGIGLAIVRHLALQYGRWPLSQASAAPAPLLIYLTARDEQRGRQAVEAVYNDPQLAEAQALRRGPDGGGGLADVDYLPLDIDSADSIRQFVAVQRQRHPDGIDILVNNAGIALEDDVDVDVVRRTLRCNYYGTLAVSELLLPHIRRPGGRIVNIASTLGRLLGGVGTTGGVVKYSDAIRQRFLQASTTEEITQLMEDFTRAVANNDYRRDWPGSAYAVSKAGVIGLTRTMAASNPALLINCVCPGYVNTDLTKGRGVRTVDQGAQTPVHLALGDIQGKTGTFWMNGKDASHRWAG